MKKYLLAALVVLSASTFAANVTVFGGVNMNGETTVKADGGEESIDAEEMGYVIGVEAHNEVAKFKNGKFELGLGTKYDSEFIVDSGSENVSYVSTLPIYASAKASFKAAAGVNVYVQGLLGYVIPFEADGTKGDDLEGGAYYGLGFGAEYGNYTAGLTYDISNYKDTYIIDEDTMEKLTDKNEYSKISLIAGYKFGK